MKCNCFNEIIEKVKESLKDKKELNISWQNEVFFFSEENNAPCVLKVESEYRRVKTNGLLYANKTKESVNVIMKYCPFCGELIKETK